MIYTLGIEPFGDYWVECIFNNCFSIIISYEPSYRYMTYLNNYKLQKEKNPSDDSIEFLNVSYPEAIYDLISFILEKQDYYFDNEENFLTELQQLIKNKQIIWVGVDMFYMIPGSLTFGMRHANHYSFISGFDDERMIYYAFEFELGGYKAHEIPQERLVTAFKNSTVKTPPAIVSRVTKNISKYSLSLDEVLINAERLMTEAANIKIDALWRIEANDEEFYEKVAQCVFALNGLINRQIGNQLLFKSIYELGMIRKENDMLGFVDLARQLEKSYGKMRNVYLRHIEHWKEGILKKELKSDRFNEMSNLQLEKEFIMWEKLLGYF
jgi:hypothetical protein